MKLNGWQRLWMFVSAPFSIGGLIGVVVGLFALDGGTILGSMAWGVGFPVFMYAFGWGIAWIRRGFKEE